jgi:hypothetical protein
MSWKKLKERIRKRENAAARRIRSALYPVTKVIDARRASKPESERPLQEFFVRSKMDTRRKKTVTLPKVRFLDE